METQQPSLLFGSFNKATIAKADAPNWMLLELTKRLASCSRLLGKVL